MATNDDAEDADRPVAVLLVRHGRTTLNAAGRLRGLADPPLDDTGLHQAERLADEFADLVLGAVVSSPRLRASQTAKAIAAPHGLDVLVDIGIEDRDYGPWTGELREEVIAQFGSVDRAPGVESVSAFEDRILAAFHRLVAEHVAEGDLVIVAHDAVNRAVLANLVAGQPEDREQIIQDTGCWNRLELVDGRWQATVVNEVPPPESK